MSIVIAAVDDVTVLPRLSFTATVGGNGVRHNTLYNQSPSLAEARISIILILA